MATEDIRLHVDALDHPKLLALQQLAGDGAVLSLIRLWCFAGKYHKTGKLASMDGKLIALASRWPVERAGEFTRALIDLRLLDEKSGVYSIHDWREIQPWIFHADKRSVAAKKAAKSKWDKKLGVNAKRMRGASKPHAKRRASVNAPSPDPIPSPLPDPKPSPTPDPNPTAEGQNLPAPQSGAARLDHRMHALWLEAGYKGNWPPWQWGKANAGIQLLKADERAVLDSWAAYLLEPDKFYRGHPPSKWADNPGSWPRPAMGIPELLKHGTTWRPPEERAKGGKP